MDVRGRIRKVHYDFYLCFTLPYMFDPWLVVAGKLLFISQKFLTECFQPVVDECSWEITFHRSKILKTEYFQPAVDDCSWEITFHWSKFLKTEYFQPVDGCGEGRP